MTNYIPARLQREPDEDFILPERIEEDENVMVEMMIQDELDRVDFENQIWERSEGVGL